MSGRTERELGALQQEFDWLERRARWKGIPAGDREKAVDALAEMLLRVVESEDEGQGEDPPETP